MSRTGHEWRAEPYRAANTGQVHAALKALARAGVPRGGRFADVGCGSGEVAEAMARRGMTVDASDVSESMVEAARARCAALPVTVEQRDARRLALEPGGYDVVHSSWMLHWLEDFTHPVRTMARAVAPGGLLVLQYSAAQARADGFALRDTLRAVADRPAWRERLREAPILIYQHPADEVSVLLAAEGLAVSPAEPVAPDLGAGDLDRLRATLRAATFAAQAEVLGDDTDAFIDECLTALVAAGALDAHNVCVVARRPPLSV
ncbi:class I SAM-dependent methyltransferase [Catenuloplanes atrovinosus]|uniref:Trans-aconitate methyltransferase n=1 Tax=Catenuloplanes atrovinosus TaxID=137266 RepID=A0AAE3YMJ1_9ACTN|nr:class I SAM-dependent methyltransferase [Catenuloplanes atrovinosus]MDR7276503.1 trans-aconitate methyltransferase [Catenuloplanes atrovinosus]